MTPEILYTLIIITSDIPFHRAPPTMAVLPNFETLEDCTSAGSIFRSHRGKTDFECVPIPTNTRSKTR